MSSVGLRKRNTANNSCYAVFAGFCFAYFPIVYVFYPETSRRTLEDMDQIFIKYPSPFVFGKPDLTRRERPQTFIDAETERVADAEAIKLANGGKSASAQVEKV